MKKLLKDLIPQRALRLVEQFKVRSTYEDFKNEKIT